MTPDPARAAGLASRLKQLRDEAETLTQNQLAAAFSAETPVSGPTISAWESPTNTKRPTRARLDAYARFFATPRSREGEPHLLAEADLTPDERDRYAAL